MASFLQNCNHRCAVSTSANVTFSVRLASLDELAVDPAAAGRVTPERVESRGFQLNLGQSIGVPSLCPVVMKRIAHLFREMRLLT